MLSNRLHVWLCLIATGFVPPACKSRSSSSAPATSAAPPAVSFRAPVWEIKMPGGYAENATKASAIGEQLVVVTPASVVVFDRRSGKKSWGIGGFGKPFDPDITLTEDVVVIAQRNTSGSDIGVYDLSTGKELWHLQFSGGAGFANAVYTSDGSCNRCPVVRRDLHTGKPKWSVTGEGFPGMMLSKLGPAATGSMLAYRGGPYVVLMSSDGKDARLYAVDAETGARHASMPSVKGMYLITDRTLVGADPESKECKVLLRGVDIQTGKSRWQTELKVVIDEWTNSACPGRPHALFSDASFLGIAPNTLFSIDAEDRPIALDLDTGVVRWRGPSGLLPIDADERTVLVRDPSGLQLERNDQHLRGRLAALDAATGKLLWKAPGPPVHASYPVTAVYGDIALDGDLEGGKQITVRNARTGVEMQPVEGSLIGAGPGWLVAKYIDMLRYYTLP